MKKILLIPMFVLSLAACGDAPDTDGTPPANPGPNNASDLGHLSTIDWTRVRAEAATPVEKEQGLLQKQQITPAELDHVSFPVLIPRDRAFLNRVNLNAKTHLYVAMGQFEDYRLRMMGVHSQAITADMPSEKRITADEAEVKFSLWGARYTIVVTCLQPDPVRCSEDTLARLVTSLIWVGGRE